MSCSVLHITAVSGASATRRATCAVSDNSALRAARTLAAWTMTSAPACHEREPDAHSSDRPRSRGWPVGSRGARRRCPRRRLHRRMRAAARRRARTAARERDRRGPARSAPAGRPRDRGLRPGLAGGAARPDPRHRLAGRSRTSPGKPSSAARRIISSKTHLDSYTLPRALQQIIERQAAEEALFFEQQRAEVTLNSIGDAVLSTDIAGNVTYLNPVAERMTGWPRQEALGRPLAEVFQIIDATTREPARNPMDQAIQLNRIVGLTPNCLLIRRDGLETAIEDSASPIHDRAGQVIGAVMVFKDVSEARAHVAAGRPPGAARLSDRPAQPHAAERPAHPGDCPGPPPRPPPGRAVPRSGSVQARERQPGTCDWRRAAAVGGTTAGDVRPELGHGQPSGRR